MSRCPQLSDWGRVGAGGAGVGTGVDGGAGGSQHACALSGGLQQPPPLAVFRSSSESTRTPDFLVVLLEDFFEALRGFEGMAASCSNGRAVKKSSAIRGLSRGWTVDWNHQFDARSRHYTLEFRNVARRSVRQPQVGHCD